MRRRRNSSNLINKMGNTLELGYVKRLEGTLGVADKVDLGLAGLGDNFFDVSGNLGSAFVDVLQSAQEWEAVVGAVGLRVGAVALGLQPGLEEVYVFIVGCS